MGFAGCFLNIRVSIFAEIVLNMMHPYQEVRNIYQIQF